MKFERMKLAKQLIPLTTCAVLAFSVSPAFAELDQTATEDMPKTAVKDMPNTAMKDMHKGDKPDTHKGAKPDMYKSAQPDMQKIGVAKKTVASWPETSQKVAGKMMDQYGAPDGITDTMLVWHDTGPWTKTIVHKEEIQHDFPVPHVDVLQQFVNYDVPIDKFSDLAEYDGSVVAERTNGQLSARCDKEAANFLAINLADDIITGKRTVAEARQHYGEDIAKLMNGEKTDYVTGLVFEQTIADVGDPDEPTMKKPMAANPDPMDE